MLLFWHISTFQILIEWRKEIFCLVNMVTAELQNCPLLSTLMNFFQFLLIDTSRTKPIQAYRITSNHAHLPQFSTNRFKSEYIDFNRSKLYRILLNQVARQIVINRLFMIFSFNSLVARSTCSHRQEKDTHHSWKQ